MTASQQHEGSAFTKLRDIVCYFRISGAQIASALLFVFFFQAEDGIRDLTVTGVQTCALPISTPGAPRAGRGAPRPRDEPPELRSGPDQLPRAVPGVRPAVPHPRRRRRIWAAPPVADLGAAGRGRAPPLGTTLAPRPPPTCPPPVAGPPARPLPFCGPSAHRPGRG